MSNIVRIFVSARTAELIKATCPLFSIVQRREHKVLTYAVTTKNAGLGAILQLKKVSNELPVILESALNEIFE